MLGRGALSALVLIAAGEATSPLQNSWYLARIVRPHSPVRPSLGAACAGAACWSVAWDVAEFLMRMAAHSHAVLQARAGS